MWGEIIVTGIVLVLIGIAIYILFKYEHKNGVVALTHVDIVPDDPATLLATQNVPAYTGFDPNDKTWNQISWSMMVVAQRKMYDLSLGNTTTNYDNLVPGFEFQSGDQFHSIWQGKNFPDWIPTFVVFAGSFSGISTEDRDTTVISGIKSVLVDRYNGLTFPELSGTVIVIGWDSGCTLALMYYERVMRSGPDVIAGFYLFGFGQSMKTDPTNLPYPSMFNWITSTTDPYCGTGEHFPGFMASSPGVSVTTSVSNVNQGHNLREYFPTLQ